MSNGGRNDLLKRKDEDYWYEESALIILLADDGTGFKIHRALLMEHSAHFQEMLEDSHLVSDQQSGGVDIIPMKLDRTLDIKHFVHSIYNPPYVFTLHFLFVCWF